MDGHPQDEITSDDITRLGYYDPALRQPSQLDRIEAKLDRLLERSFPYPAQFQWQATTDPNHNRAS